MLDIHRTDDVPDTKTYFTHSNLPSYTDPQNVSTKKQPFATFNKQPYSHTLDLILPAELYDLIQHKLSTSIPNQYARVHMKLSELLDSEFLTTYIKQGNIMMLSEGRALIDNRIELYDGILRLELDRQTYERCGLQGSPIEDGGKKHQKARWVVTYNLRLPSMKHGKSGFGRLEWAAKNVLDRSLTWLFYNFNPGSVEALVEGREVLSGLAPWVVGMEPKVRRLDGVVCPKLEKMGDLSVLYEEDEAMSLLEWFDLVRLDSPRIKAGDEIDPYLSRYEVPDFVAGKITRDMVCVRWKGFMPPAYAREIFLAAREGLKTKSKADSEGDANMKDATEEEKWFALSAQGFGGKNGWTVLQFADNATLTWETES